MNKQRGDFPLSYLFGAGLLITGFAIIAVFSGATLGKIFLFGGVAAFVVGYFLEKEKSKKDRS